MAVKENVFVVKPHRHDLIRNNLLYYVNILMFDRGGQYASMVGRKILNLEEGMRRTMDVLWEWIVEHGGIIWQILALSLVLIAVICLQKYHKDVRFNKRIMLLGIWGAILCSSIVMCIFDSKSTIYAIAQNMFPALSMLLIQDFIKFDHKSDAETRRFYKEGLCIAGLLFVALTVLEIAKSGDNKAVNSLFLPLVLALGVESVHGLIKYRMNIRD